MRLLCDEDIGTRVPSALHMIGYDVTSMHDLRWRARQDTDWIVDAASSGFLVVSCNKKMLLVPEERQAIIDSKLGVVYFTSGEISVPDMLLILLKNWKRLEEIDSHLKPLAYFLTPSGRVKTQYRAPDGVLYRL